MDLPPPVSQKSYERILRKINLANREVADDSLKKAAKEEVSTSGSNEICVRVMTQVLIGISPNGKSLSLETDTSKSGFKKSYLLLVPNYGISFLEEILRYRFLFLICIVCLPTFVIRDAALVIIRSDILAWTLIE
ncbi:hypothetical protein TNCV_2511831 [Trichonephila clavipes]|nr:hypothetical protein TNCV_2511831 [Trichonephila clavipes]